MSKIVCVLLAIFIVCSLFCVVGLSNYNDDFFTVFRRPLNAISKVTQTAFDIIKKVGNIVLGVENENFPYNILVFRYGDEVVGVVTPYLRSLWDYWYPIRYSSSSIFDGCYLRFFNATYTFSSSDNSNNVFFTPSTFAVRIAEKYGTLQQAITACDNLVNELQDEIDNPFDSPFDSPYDFSY